MMDSDNVAFFVTLIIGIVIGCIITCSIFAIINPIILSQETIDDICQQITGNENAIGDNEDKKLICEIPSFDDTQNIIIRTNDE